MNQHLGNILIRSNILREKQQKQKENEMSKLDLKIAETTSQIQIIHTIDNTLRRRYTDMVGDKSEMKMQKDAITERLERNENQLSNL
jgi:hypothetical protein